MSTISASTTTTTAYKVTADTTGTLVLQTGSTPTTAVTIGTDQSVTTAGTINSLTVGRGAGSVSTNTAVGASALAANTTGGGNQAFGVSAGASLTTGNNNTALGRLALATATTPDQNTAVGYASLYLTTTGQYNTSVGGGSLQNNTTASNNTAVGYQAGYTNSTGEQNTFIGRRAGYSATGGFNTFVGTAAGFDVTSGTKNTIIGGYQGNSGGLDIRTANNNIVLSDGDGNPHASSYLDTGTGNTQFRIHNTGGQYVELVYRVNNTTKAEIWWDNSLLRLQTYTGSTNGPYISNNGTSWTNSSDERLKNITGEIQNGLTKVCSLRAAEYTWKADESAKPQVGLIAQDVLAVLPEAVTVPEDGATEKDGSPAMMGVQYNEVIPLLVAAIKELKAEIDTLKGQA